MATLRAPLERWDKPGLLQVVSGEADPGSQVRGGLARGLAAQHAGDVGAQVHRWVLRELHVDPVLPALGAPTGVAARGFRDIEA